MVVSLPVALKPLYFLFYVAGLHTCSSECTNKCLRFLKISSCVLSTTLCFSSLFVFATSNILEVLVSESPQSLYATSFLFGDLFLAVSFRFFCQKHLRTFFEELECYKTECCAQETTNYKSILMINLVGVFLLFCNVCSGAVTQGNIFIGQPCLRTFAPFPSLMQSVFCSQIVGMLLFYFSSQVYNTIFFTYLTTWRILQLEANSINRALLNQDRQVLKENPEVIEAIRLRHAHLCHVIGCANEFIRHVLAAIYGAGVPCLLLVMHGLIYKSISIRVLSGMGGMIFFFIVYIAVITLTGAALNRKMHEPVEFLFRLDVQRMTGKGTEIVSTFLARVQGAPIGFNVYNIFTVDTSTVAMICGTLLTYALVIIQFPKSDATPQSPDMSTDLPLAVTYANTDQPDLTNYTEF